MSPSNRCQDRRQSSGCLQCCGPHREDADGPRVPGKYGAEGLLFDIEGKTPPHNRRFAAWDRAMLDKRVEELLETGRKHGGRVIVGTKMLDHSLDIDADLLSL